jgi:hypothetical protein
MLSVTQISVQWLDDSEKRTEKDVEEGSHGLM